MTETTEKESDNEQSTLKKIKELSKESFEILTPMGGDKEGYYLNNARINNYVELFGTLKSMLNVCILALDAEEDNTLNIKNKEADVKSVLEFAKNLIPMEEGHLLDDIRRLFLSDKEYEI